ncbi:hypothetical protein PAXINDRAFT_17373 [Paxillus involutus ATCC 200175]|uniref:Protein kinase domain-containing protein n=1 Tax=Paxillus involutus ATCC 200175 TaxID=664439 RepID=A0A0C9TP36_PAXIN|nr:hypothetical protein PAXINDRAFT_17373 [Paxillus involutus ATCC 200175]
MTEPPHTSQSTSLDDGESRMTEIRNWMFLRPDRIKRDAATVPSATTSATTSTSFRNSASNRLPGEKQTRAAVDSALHDELHDARYLTDDLGDLMFSPIISTELAKEILQGLFEAGMVGVRRIDGDSDVDVGNNTEYATAALEHAYQRALAHGCRRQDVDQTKTPSKAKNLTEVSWSWSWKGFPTSTIKEAPLMDYFNQIVDTALGLQCLKGRKVCYRFAAPIDTRHAFPLAYGPDNEDMRPDFVVLPIDAFEDNNATGTGHPIQYKPKKEWLNFTTIRLSGECKTSASNKGVDQVQRYMRGMRRAQPWQRFVTALTVTREIVTFMRADASGIERLNMQLVNGRSSLEFVRVLLAVALGNATHFGKSTAIDVDIQLKSTTVALLGDTVPATESNDAISAAPPASDLPAQDSHLSTASVPQSKKQTSGFAAGASRSSQKRKRDNEDNAENPPPAGKQAPERVNQMVQLPTNLFGNHKYQGILYNAASLRGRGTTVVVVRENNARVVLKMAWQDVTRGSHQAEVLRILGKNQGSEPDERNAYVLIPTNISIDEDRTLGIIRAFTDSQIRKLRIEDRILQVQKTELRRPVMYFWSAHDFVLGLRDAIIGHGYLVDIGILHRDVSENNIVLGCFPEGARGCIMDLDMAIPYMPQSSSESFDLKKLRDDVKFKRKNRKAPMTSQTSGPFQADRTGTTPYMSIKVLLGEGHTHFDDMESFFYVLLLFFISYDGPMSKENLLPASERGFTLQFGRPAHIRTWPPAFLKWSAEDMDTAADSKKALFGFGRWRTHLHQISALISKRWVHNTLRDGITDLLMDCWELFYVDNDGGPAKVSHEQFIGVLNKWLKVNEQLPEGCNNCPFNDPNGKQKV